jgi:carboxyl-terminal processing protease
MMNSTMKYLVIGMVLTAILFGTFSAGVLAGQAFSDQLALNNPGTWFGNSKITNSGTNVDNEELLKPFWEAWDIIQKQYVDQPVNDQNLIRGAIRGMLASLEDPHTSYMDPDEFRQANLPLEGSYEGIGAWVDTTGDWLTIISPMPGSPAEAAGLMAEDQIRAVDDEDMTGIAGELVLRRVLGPAGTPLKLTIFRPSQERTFEVNITRSEITVPSVEGELLEGGIAYVRLFTFGADTGKEFRTVLKELASQNPVGLILDLRNNGGGYLNTAIEVLTEVLPSGKIAMIEEKGDGSRIELRTQRGGRMLDVPLVVLVNGGSASASEIAAGAIQDYERGVLVGEKTFGKGSVQNWVPLSDDEGAVKITIARWLTPKERQINKQGLTPDYEVQVTEDDLLSGVDPQLEKAINLLTKAR